MLKNGELKRYIAGRAAKELHDGDVVNLGIGIPTLVVNYLPDDVHVFLQSENGIVGTGPIPEGERGDPVHVVDAGGAPVLAGAGGCYIDSSTSFGMIRGGHVDCTILGALEVDSDGSMANWIIPGRKVPGMGGAMDLVVGAKKVVIAMEHTLKGMPKILSKCTLPLTAVGCVDLIITEMGVMEVTADGLLLTEYNPVYTLDEIQMATGAELTISCKLKHMDRQAVPCAV